MGIDIGSVAKDMLSAAVTSAGNDWNKIKTVATKEIKTLAQRIVMIARGLANRTIELEDGRDLLSMAKNNAIAMVAMLVTGVKALIQKAINAALAVVKNAVNAAAGVRLLV